LEKYTADQINGTAFDPDSIMLYFFPASWTLNGIATKANDVLSSMDKGFIAGAKMYPKTGGTVSSAKELKVNAGRRTAASIGKIGEEDLYRFTAATDGRYVIDTSGPTDIVMKLFGPNSETAVIEEDERFGHRHQCFDRSGFSGRRIFLAGAALQSHKRNGEVFDQSPQDVTDCRVYLRYGGTWYSLSVRLRTGIGSRHEERRLTDFAADRQRTPSRSLLVSRVHFMKNYRRSAAL
jgi:hypothetical protein